MEEDLDISDFVEKCNIDHNLIIQTCEVEFDLIDRSYTKEWDEYQKQLKDLESKNRIKSLEREVERLTKKCKDLEKSSIATDKMSALITRYNSFLFQFVPAVKSFLEKTSQKNKESWDILASSKDPELTKSIAQNINCIQAGILEIKNRFSSSEDYGV